MSEMKKVFIGIDPGANGAMAILEEGKAPRLVCCDYERYRLELQEVVFPQTEEDLRRGLRARVAVEDVHAMPMNGCVGNFKLGWSLGRIIQIVDFYLVPCQLVKPQQWQKEYGISNRDKSKSQSIETAKRLFPGVDLRRTDKCTKDHDGFADALLIAEWCRRHLA